MPQKPRHNEPVNFAVSLIWVGTAAALIYIANFFYNIFFNPVVWEPFLSLALSVFSFLIVYALYVSYILPLKHNVKNCQEYNPRLITIGAVAGGVALLSILIAIWPIWGFTSLILLGFLWKGFWEMARIMPRGKHSNIGGLLFIALNVLAVQSHRLIAHSGYLH